MSILDRLNILKQKRQEIAPKLYKFKTRFSLLGTVGAGKTTVGGGLLISAQTLSSMMPEFRCRVLEGSSGIRVAASNLRRGRFPPKTPANLPSAPEAGLLLYWGGLFGEKKVQIPFCDISGERVQQVIQKYGEGMYPTEEAYDELSMLMRYIYDADGLILVIPASRALIFTDDRKVEAEPTGIAEDPDVNLARILESVFEYKEETGSKKLKAILAIITKWDLLQPYAKSKKMDIQDPTGEGLQNFMDIAFPDTMMSLKAYGLENVRFFPSYFKVKRETVEINGKKQVRLAKWSDGGDRIEMHEKILRMPKFPERTYKNMFDCLKNLA